MIAGKEGAYKAAGDCHLSTDEENLTPPIFKGLPVAYFLQQLADMKDDKRHASMRTQAWPT